MKARSDIWAPLAFGRSRGDMLSERAKRIGTSFLALKRGGKHVTSL